MPETNNADSLRFYYERLALAVANEKQSRQEDLKPLFQQLVNFWQGRVDATEKGEG